SDVCSSDLTSSNNEAARTIISMWPLWTGSKDPGHTARCIVVNVVYIYLVFHSATTLLLDSLITCPSYEVHHSFAVSTCVYHIDIIWPGRFWRFIGTF